MNVEKRFSTEPVVQTESPLLHELLKTSESLRSPSLQLVNTRVFLREWQDRLGEDIRLCDLPQEAWNEISGSHDAVWLMGIYPPSAASRQIALQYYHQYAGAFPGLSPTHDVVASPFAVPDYSPASNIADGWSEWDAKIRDRFHKQGKKIYLDFVSNHVAKEHPWTTSNPNHFISASEAIAGHVSDPDEFSEIEYSNGMEKSRYAHGKDPWSPPWTDTLQLNYANPALCKAQIGTLLELSDHCDGVRCDMAHLLLPDNFMGKWGWLLSDEEKKWMGDHPFWSIAISLVQDRMRQLKRIPFDFIAEAYDDHDIQRLLHSGFTGAYEKDGLYRRLLEARNHGFVQDNLEGHLRYLTEQVTSRPVLFTENHDEPRAVEAFRGVDPSLAAAAITGLVPKGIFMTHQGQMEGYRIKLPMQVKVKPSFEQEDPRIHTFYNRLLSLRRSILWQQGKATVPSHDSLDHSLIAQQVELDGVGAVACTNFSGDIAQGGVEIPTDRKVTVYDLTKGEFLPDDIIAQPQDGHEFVQLAPWQTQIVFYER